MKENISRVEKELFFEADTRKHQQLVAKYMLTVAQKLMTKAMQHDESKLKSPEKDYYVDPVYELNNSDITYGSDEFKEVIKKLGEGGDIHTSRNDHHIEFFVPYSVQTLNDPIMSMDLIALVEMLCDWIAASKRKNNSPAAALAQLHQKFPMDEQLQAIIRNTLPMIERWAEASLR